MMRLMFPAAPTTDPWLDRWLPEFTAQTDQPAVLELGCGPGWDTRTLFEAGLRDITALDIQERSRQACELLGATFHQHDLRQPLPFADGQFDALLASLCLHYFPWRETQAAFNEVRRVLRPDGLFLGRVNSVNDVNYGAVGFPELERHFYQYGERTKRFCDQTDIQAIFRSGWQVLSQQELTIHRYGKPKVVWEVVARRNGR